MNFLIFVVFYLICTSILFLISYIIFKKYIMNRIIDSILKEAFNNKDISEVEDFGKFVNSIHVIDDDQENKSSPLFF